MDSTIYILWPDRGRAYVQDKTTYVYEGTKCRGGLRASGGGGVIVGLYGNIKGHPQDTIRVTVSEYNVYNLLLASPL